MTRYERIKEVLDNMEMEDLLAIHNEYCMESNNDNDQIYAMEMFDDLMDSCTPYDIALTCYLGKFSPTHEYFCFNGNGNLTSSNYPADWIYTNDIARYIDQTENSLSNSDIQDILNETEEEDK